jgi:Na+/alanine symporter
MGFCTLSNARCNSLRSNLVHHCMFIQKRLLKNTLQRWIVTFGIVFFAYSTILGWCYYGEKCCTYLLGEKYVLLYRLIYIASVFIGCVASLDLVWLFADTFNGLMAVPNLIALLSLSNFHQIFLLYKK